MGNSNGLTRVGRWVIRLGNTIETISGVFGVSLFVLMLLSALFGVFFRYVMKSPFQWTEEVARYCLIWLGFVAINMAIWRGEHITITALLEHLPGWMVRLLAFLVHVLCGFFLIVLLYKGSQMTARTLMTAQALPCSMYWFYLAVPVSAGLSLVQTFLCILRLFLAPHWQPRNIGV